MYAVVTGGSGFLGSHVVEELLRRGHRVGIYDLNPPRRDLEGQPGWHYLAGDLSDLDSVASALTDAEVVCHLGGVGDVYLAAKEPATAAQRNVVGTANVCEAALRHKVGKVVYTSTWEVYGSPIYQPIDERHPCSPDHPYNITKYAGELIAMSYDRLRGLPVLALRLGSAYGLRMRPNSVFSIFIERALAGEPISIQGTGEQSRQFTHARDIARAFVLGAESTVHHEAVNIVSDESVTIRGLAELICEKLPTKLTHTLARSGDIAPARVSSKKASTLLDWQAEVRFEAGLRDMIEAAREQRRKDLGSKLNVIA
jgi:UDP-glucose 4-epimerase